MPFELQSLSQHVSQHQISQPSVYLSLFLQLWPRESTSCVRNQMANSHHPTARCAEGALYDGYKHECVDQFLDNIACGPQEPSECIISVSHLSLRVTLFTSDLARGQPWLAEAPLATTPDPLEALPCDPQDCQLPYCHCSFDGTEIPGGLRAEQVPQIIMLTFDGAVNDLNFDTYNQIFLENRTSPNGCPIRGTFFVSHDYTNYQLVEEFYSRGHEIALGTVTRRSGLEDGTYEEWVGEMVTMREILSSFSGVRKADIFSHMFIPPIHPTPSPLLLTNAEGQSPPYLSPPLPNTTHPLTPSLLQVMNDYGFSWDSTINAPPSKVPVWPYSFDYKIPHECRSGSCATRSFRGLWEMPMNSHFKNFQFEGGFCPYLDQCSFSYQNEPDVLKWLQDDFNRHYTTNRAPYMLALSTNWFQTPTQTNGLLAFIDWTMTLNDVYYTTMTEALQWVTTPQPISELSRFQPWSCQQKVYPDPPCETPNSCQLSLNARHDNFTSAGGSRYMVTCSNCPTVYPWVWDSTGLGRERDIYEPEFRSTNIEDPAIL
ncbi:chitin deacetylase 1 precursor [Penaeus vannamei]|uniref:Chitin deacetylase 1 n=1 Tax=Penaeus vannamei TaxID=6689 RepID=A0A3R7QCN8_PENVA|nr:chitin deacetylase 1 precursor [Penaeus vannamei]